MQHRELRAQSLFRTCHADIPAHQRVHPHLSYRETQWKMILHQVQQQREGGVRAVEHWGTSCKIPQKPITKIKMRTSIEHGEPVARSARMVGGTHWTFCGRRRFCFEWSTRKHHSWTAPSRTFDKSGIEQAQHIYSLPERPKLRSLHEDQNYKSSWQKTHW